MEKIYLSVLDHSYNTVKIIETDERSLRPLEDEEEVDALDKVFTAHGVDLNNCSYEQVDEFPLDLSRNSKDFLDQVVNGVRDTLWGKIQVFIDRYVTLEVKMAPWFVLTEDEESIFIFQKDLITMKSAEVEGNTEISRYDFCTEDLLFIVEYIEEKYSGFKPISELTNI